MSYVTSNQGRPIQGVSQQPDKNRYPGQCSLSENFRPDIVRGLTTRQGTHQTGTLTGASKNPLSKWHHYVRNEEEYLIEIQPSGVVKAWSPDGTVHTVTVEDSAGDYLANSNPLVNLDTMTVGDYTFLINRDVIVTESSSTSPVLEHKAIVYVQFMDYGQQIAVHIDGVKVGWHDSRLGSEPTTIKSVNPATVAEHLVEGMQGNSSSGSDAGDWDGVDISADYDFELQNNCIFISRKDGADFNIRVTDDVEGANAVAIYKSIEQTTLLPNSAPSGFKVKVQPPGGNTSEDASFWLEATTTDGSSGNTLTWEESIEPGIPLGIDPSTMPHVLVRESVTSGVATFTLRQGEWEDREVGDEDSNPLPAFIGETIKSMGIMQNRLYFTSGESVNLSRSNRFFNFFRATVQVSLDTSPISVYADSAQINYLNASVGFDGDLVFFSDSAQFILPGEQALTTANAVLRKTTDFETDLSVKPVASGDSIFFAFNYGQFAGVREYFTDSITDTKRARPVTDHVKEYIKGIPEIMVTSTNLNLLLIKATEDNVIYTYDWLWQGTEKAQSAWGRLIFQEGDKILHMAFVDDKLRLVFERDDETVECETVDLGDANSTGLSFPARIDRMKEITFTLDGDTWKVSDPLPNVPIDNIRIVRATGCYDSEIGTLINFTREGSELWSIDDLSSQATCNGIAGISYECSYMPTNPIVKDQNEQAMNLDKLTVGAFYVNYNTTGSVTAIVEDLYGNVRESNYGNRTLGGPENLVGFSPLVEGQHRIPIRKKSDKYTLKLKTESHIPLTIRDFSFNGNLNRRGVRI